MLYYSTVEACKLIFNWYFYASNLDNNGKKKLAM